MASPRTDPVGLAWKRLSPVEVDQSRSRQHEFHASGLQTILGRPVGKDTRPATYHYWRPEHPKPLTASSTFTYYDARENHPSRTELRLYYPRNTATKLAEAGDLFLIEFADGGANVHIVQNGSPRWSSLLNCLSHADAAPSNTLRVLRDEIALESEILSNTLSLLPGAGTEVHIAYEIERSALVAATCAELVSSGERPNVIDIAAAVGSIQVQAWSVDSIDGAIARRMILERHIHQEIEVLRLQGNRTTATQDRERLRYAVQISAAHLQASERHLGQAFVAHVLDALNDRFEPGCVRVQMLSDAAAFVAVSKSISTKETLILLCGREYPERYLEDSAVSPDWVLTPTFPSADSVAKLVRMCTTTKLATARIGRASQSTTSDVWGPDLDAVVRSSA